MQALDAAETARLLPYLELARILGDCLLKRRQGMVNIPERLVVGLPHDAKLLVMPAADETFAITKLVTVHPANHALNLPTIQGEVVVMRAGTGERLGVLDGATVTARRTAALSLLAAMRLAPDKSGPLLVIGAGAQALAHAEAFRAGLGTRQLIVSSRTRTRAEALAERARSLGMKADVVDEPHEALADVSVVVTATTTRSPVLRTQLNPRTMVCAVGSFRPEMAELSPAVLENSSVIVDTLDAARAEGGDLIQAAATGRWRWEQATELHDWLADPAKVPQGPVVFKSVGHALFDLAASQLAFGPSGPR